MEESNKSKLFNLGKVSKRHLILYILSPFTYYYNNKFLDYLKKNHTWYNSSLNYFSIFLGYTLIGLILIIYTKIIMDNNNNQSFVHKKDLNLSIEKIEALKVDIPLLSINKLMFFILIIILDSLCTYIFTYFQKFPYFFKYLGYLYPLEIISFILLSKFILKLKIYKHHLFSLIIIIIGLLLINIINFTSISYKLNELFVILSLLILQYLYPLLDIIIYHILYEKDFNFTFFLLFIGIMGIFIGIIISFMREYLSLTFLNINIFQDIYNFKNDTLLNLLIFIFITLCNGITYCLLYSIFKLFKPWAYAITAVINGLLNVFHDIINVIFGNNEFSILLLFQIIIYIILFIACLIFNEQIICNFWELNKNTKEEIIKRSIIDIRTTKLYSLENIY